jgi:hypothetical protein
VKRVYTQGEGKEGKKVAITPADIIGYDKNKTETRTIIIVTMKGYQSP